MKKIIIGLLSILFLASCNVKKEDNQKNDNDTVYNIPFNSANWKKGTRNDRYKMADDFIDNYYKLGMEKQELVDYLGEPDDIASIILETYPPQDGGKVYNYYINSEDVEMVLSFHIGVDEKVGSYDKFINGKYVDDDKNSLGMVMTTEYVVSEQISEGTYTSVAESTLYKINLIDDQNLYYDDNYLASHNYMFAPNDIITIYAHIICDADVIMYVDGKKYLSDNENNLNKFSFVMPSHDVEVKLNIEGVKDFDKVLNVSVDPLCVDCFVDLSFTNIKYEPGEEITVRAICPNDADGLLLEIIEAENSKFTIEKKLDEAQSSQIIEFTFNLRYYDVKLKLYAFVDQE